MQSPSSTFSSHRDAIASRLQVDYLLNPEISCTLNSGDDVVTGLSQTPKTLPPRYFYDDRGSQLFEQICELPEYYLTRTETRLLQESAAAIAHLTGPCDLVELGSGSATKTRILLDAYAELGQGLHYSPVDISAGILESSARDLLAMYPRLHIHGRVSTYELALAQLAQQTQVTPDDAPGCRMICFLGSTLGNLSPVDCHHFFEQVLQALQPGDYFLVGVDLQKPIEVLNAAYNDRQGVTAAFNLNMLRHLNRRFQGNFNVDQFAHWAFYHTENQQIEMHLRSLCAQTVQLRSLDLTVEFAADETIHTEISRKFTVQQVQQELSELGLAPVQTWMDDQQWFGLILCQRS